MRNASNRPALTRFTDMEKRILRTRVFRRNLRHGCSSSKRKISFLFSLNEMVLFSYIVLMKTRREITTNRLKIASSLLSRKYETKEGQRVEKVSNCFATMLEPISILILSIIYQKKVSISFHVHYIHLTLRCLIIG